MKVPGALAPGTFLQQIERWQDTAQGRKIISPHPACTAFFSKVPGATGENAIAYNAGRADVIIAPMGAYFANGLMGEISASMANALCQSAAYKIAVPGADSPGTTASHRALSASEEVRQATTLLRQRCKS